MRKICILLLVLNMLLLLSANTLAGVPANTDERYSFLGESNGLYYYGWAVDVNGQSVNKQLWIKIMPGDTGGELLKEQGDSIAANQEIDSILCCIPVEDDVRAIQMAEQIYYDQSGTVIAHWVSSEWNGQTEKTSTNFIADECAAFLTAYFSYK